MFPRPPLPEECYRRGVMMSWVEVKDRMVDVRIHDREIRSEV